MLKVQELQVNYGGIRAVKNISFEVPDGSIVTLVGANGAGKSTTLRTIAGQVKAQAGSITYNGEELLGKPSDEIVKRGITLVPEGRRVFPDMTVLENMKIGAYYYTNCSRYKLQNINENGFSRFFRYFFCYLFKMQFFFLFSIFNCHKNIFAHCNSKNY